MMPDLFRDPLFLPALAACLAAGIALGVAYFMMLRRTVDLLTAGGSPGKALLLIAARMALIGGGLVLAALTGAGPLLAMALGIWIGRSIVMRRQAGRQS